MRLARTASILGALALVAACSTQPRMTTAERLEFYRANAGEPVRSIAIPGRLWGWRALGDSALTVWPRSNEGFLLELVGRCPDLPFATKIGLSTRTGRLSAGFDSVIVPSRSSVGPTIGCRINTIRPLNTRVVKEAKSDLQEVEAVEQEGATTGETQ